MGNADSTNAASASSSYPAQSTSGSSRASVSNAAPAVSSSNVAPPASQSASASATPSNPGAYRMPGRPSNQRFYVTIPRGVRPGQHFAVLVNGQQMMVRCPEENRPGDRLIVTAPRQQAQQYVVTVPANVRPGQQFRVMINSQEVMVTCPRGVRPGQRVTFQLPQQDRAPQAAPNHQMFEVVVPDGVRPGQPFALIANGQRVMVTCPPNVRPGQKIRFQLPIQLSQQQLEAIRVSYDKDGWMRCLGQDLKFHWVFNKSVLVAAEQRKIPFDIDANAFIRELLPSTGPTGTEVRPGDIRFISATDYALDTTVKGTTVNYQEINSVAVLPFQQKVDWLKNQFSALRIPWEEGHIKIRVRRASLLQDAMDAMESIEVNDMKKVFRFEFIGEPALDAGGVTREFYSILTEQLCNPDVGLFLYSSANQMCMQFNQNSGIANEYHLRYFHMLGRVLGKSLMDNQITPVHFVQPLYKHIMGWPVTLRDLEHIDDQVYRNLSDLLDFDDVGSLYLEFVATEDKLGVAETVELVRGGSDITVNNENLPLYLQAQLKYRLLDRISMQLSSFLRGFYDVVPEPLLSVFDFQELELLLHGLPNIDMDDWLRNTEYTGEFAQNPTGNRVVQWFWEIVRNFDLETKAKLLQFVTGTAGVPVQGFGFLQGNDGNIRKFTIHGDKNVKVFPRAHTCFNRIDMPIYKTKAEMQKFLTMAVSIESSGFDIE
jgi:hypothetical protein